MQLRKPRKWSNVWPSKATTGIVGKKRDPGIQFFLHVKFKKNPKNLEIYFKNPEKYLWEEYKESRKILKSQKNILKIQKKLRENQGKKLKFQKNSLENRISEAKSLIPAMTTGCPPDLRII